MSLAQHTLLREYQLKWVNARDYTLALVRAYPEDQLDFQPATGMFTFREQVLHMIRNMNWLTADYLDGKKMLADLKYTDYDKEQLIELLELGFNTGLEAVAALDPGRLNVEHEFFAGPMTTRQILVLMNDHLTHHRGQLIVYARLQGVEPPRYRGW